MGARAKAKRQLEEGLREWIKRQPSQDVAAGILGIYRTQVSAIMNDSCPNDVGYLLDLWERSGGVMEVRLGRSSDES